MIQQTVTVALGDRSYPVYIGSDMSSLFASKLTEHGARSHIIVISDTNVAKLHLRALRHSINRASNVDVIVVPSGERSKSQKQAERIYTQLIKDKVDRFSTIVAFGGGVVGDLAGFIAATYQRGIRFVQVPTTLLAAVDSSVGGKVGINHKLAKNMIGAFYQPAFVWMDASFLRTLPGREIVCGYGEIVKYGIIKDAALFDAIERNVGGTTPFEKDALLSVISRCCEIKAEIVRNDEREGGERMILNLGHTIGHALEAAGGFRLLKHGEAVLAGIVAETHLALLMGICNEETFNKVKRVVDFFPWRHRLEKLRRNDIISALERDKKINNGQKIFVLPKRIGAVEIAVAPTASLIREAVTLLLKKEQPE
jgi:3-dehydroquinate synthase